jgi:hypothetical protein
LSAGFYKRRRGILEHIESGEVDLLESGIHDYLSLKANLLIGSQSSIPVGVVYTSAPAIHVHCKRVCERTIQRILGHLEAIGWIKSFKIDGKRGNYPVLMCRASVHDLSRNEYRINGDMTVDYQHPVYEPVGEVSGSCPESAESLSGNREERVKTKEKKKKEGAPATPSLSIFTGQHFSVTQKQDALLGEAFPGVDRAIEYRKADSWIEANPERRPKKSSRFLHNWFSRVVQPKGKSDAKPKTGAVSPDDERLAAVQDRERHERDRVN